MRLFGFDHDENEFFFSFVLFDGSSIDEFFFFSGLRQGYLLSAFF